jgi:hypothetical protein
MRGTILAESAAMSWVRTGTSLRGRARGEFLIGRPCDRLSELAVRFQVGEEQSLVELDRAEALIARGLLAM